MVIHGQKYFQDSTVEHTTISGWSSTQIFSLQGYQIFRYKESKTRKSFQESNLQPGLFWVLEQIPGYFQREDLTKVLENKTFWPSYNSPYFQG